jgi:hypothetical protein
MTSFAVSQCHMYEEGMKKNVSEIQSRDTERKCRAGSKKTLLLSLVPLRSISFIHG